MRAMENDPGLRVTKRGRTILFTPEQFARTVKALEWSALPPSRAKRTVSVARTGRAAQALEGQAPQRARPLVVSGADQAGKARLTAKAVDGRLTRRPPASRTRPSLGFKPT